VARSDSFQSRIQELERLWSDADCWPWAWRTDKDGYGRHHKFMAHRVAYQLAIGAIPNRQPVRLARLSAIHERPDAQVPARRHRPAPHRPS